MARAVKTVRIAAWIIGGLLALLVLVVALLHTPPARRFALRKTVEILDRNGVKFDASQVNYNLAELSATLQDVVVQSTERPDLPPLFAADRVEVDLGLRALLGGGYAIEDATIRNPRLHLVIDENGQTNIPQTPERQQSDQKTDYFADKILIEGGSIRVDDRARQASVDLPLKQIVVDGDPLTENHTVTLDAASGGTLSFRSESLPLTNASADVIVEENAANIRRLQLGLGDSQATITGRIDSLDKPKLDLKGTSTLELASLARFGGVRQAVAGTVKANLSATGTLDALQAEAKVNAEDLTVDEFRSVDLQADAAYDAAAERLRLRSLKVDSPMGKVTGTADLALKSGQSTANLATTSLDLSRFQVASRADAKIAAQFPALEFEKATADANVRLTATRQAPARNLLPVSGTLSAKSAGNRIVVNTPGLRALDAQLEGTVTLVNRQALDGKVRIHTPNAGSTIRNAEAYLGRQITTTPVSGAIDLAADLGGTVKSPTADAALSAPSLAVGDLKDVNLEAKARYTPQRLAIGSAAINWQGQTISASGTVGLQGRAPAINLQAQTSTIDIATVLAALNKSDVPASGQLTLDAKVTGTTRTPEADLRITGGNLVAYNEPLGNLQASANLRNQVLTVPELRLGDGALVASATYGLDTKAYTFSADSNGLKLTALTLPSGTPVRGVLDFEAKGSGTTDNPAANIQLTAEGLRIADQEIGDAKLAASVANQQVDIDASVPRFKLAADARIGTQAPYPATFEIKAGGTDLATLPLNQPIKGSITGTVKGAADLANPEHGQATAEIAALDLIWNDQPLRTEGPLVARYDSQRLTINQATVVAGDSRVSLEGTLPLDAKAGEGAINLNAKLDLFTLAPYIPGQQSISARGTATIDGSVRGTLKRIDPNITIALDRAYFSTPESPYPISNATLSAQIANGALRIDSASANYGPAALTASGTIPFGLLPASLPVELPRAQGPATFIAELRDLDIGSLEGVPSNVDGRLGARLEASAPRADLEALTGKLTFPQLRLALGTFTLEQAGQSEIRLSNGTAQITNFALSGPETLITLSGTAGLTGKRPLNVRVDGNTDAAIIGAFSDDIRAEGETFLELAVTGTAQDPQARGTLRLEDAQVSMREPRLGAENLNLRINVAGTRATISQLSGTLNGGDLTGGGTIEYAKGGFRNTNVNLKAIGVYLQYPQDLRTVSDIDLNLTSRPNQTLLAAGNVVVQEGGYTEDIHPGSTLLARSGDAPELEFTEDRNPMLAGVRFNIGIRTANPIIIENNFAAAEIEADLRLLGTPYEPGLSGRLTIIEGGELRLQERRYAVERGVITFNNEREIEPTLDVLATTNVEGYDIRLLITGTPGDTETTLTSEPSLPEPDILALLLTGKTMDEMRGQEFEVARNQVLSYLSGSVGSRIGSGIAGATGLSTVRIEPNLIAAEGDPGARLTVGQDITRNLELVYSMNLINSSDQIYIAEYDITRRFTTRGTRQSDGSFRFDFRHDVRFGGTPAPRRGERREQRRIGDINIVGNRYFTDLKIADKLGVETGDRYDFFKIRKGLDRIEKMYTKADRLETRVRLKRQENVNLVDLGITVKPSPIVDFVFEGANVPSGVRDKVRDIWRQGVFDTQRAEEASGAIRSWLVDDKHLQAKIAHTITEPLQDRKRIVFDIQPGPKFENVELVFDGANGMEPARLRDVIDDQKLSTAVHTDPAQVAEILTRFYKEHGFLDAEVQRPTYELDAQTRTAKVIFPVKEGVQFKVGDVLFAGNSVIPETRLTEEVPLPTGEPYRPILRQNAIERIRQVYWDKGYNDVEIESELKRGSGARVDLAFNITEHGQSVVHEVVVEGLERTSENLVRTQLELESGDILDLAKLAASRRNLYNTGAYSLIEITREDVDESGQSRARAADGGQAPQGTGQRPIRLTVRVREVQPYEIRYGGFFDTERGPGGIIDLANRNSLGSARVLGLRARYDSQLAESRVYFSQPELRRFPFKTIVSPFIRRERNPESEDVDAFNVDRIGFTLQQESRFRRYYLFNYGYNIERSRSYDPLSPDDLFDIRLRVASLTSTFSRDSRDELLDASRGSFWSNAIQFSPELLGSQVRFIKYFGQYFKYIPLQKPRVELFTNRVERPRLVYAGGIRVGLARGFGDQILPTAERFFAGGSNTVRGFEQNSIGPRLGRTALGGQAMVVINNELRVPLFSIFDGVTFLDVGNVYNRIGDISITDLRRAGGLGLRVRTPWFLLRLDYGLKLDRRPGESRGRIFFSIGQAF